MAPSSVLGVGGGEGGRGVRHALFRSKEIGGLMKRIAFLVVERRVGGKFGDFD